MGRNNEHISDETLLGFLLEALPEEEQQKIALRVSSDPIVAQRVLDLKDLLEPHNSLDFTQDSVDRVQSEFGPPYNLTESTMALIANSDQTLVPAGSMTVPAFESKPATQLAWLDSLVALAAGIIILCVVAPSIFVSRESARRVTCAANLRELGQAIHSFAYGNTDRRVPNIDIHGPLSFAGIYPMRLKDAGLLVSSEHVWCPAAESIDLDQPIPTTITFLSASPSARTNLRYTAGGNYAYNLGYVLSGQYITPTMESNNNFALMGDTILSTESDGDSPVVHGRNAANILFADGQIRYVRIDRIDAIHVDHPYLNTEHKKAAGIGDQDCCLGPSHQFPLIPIQ